MESLDLLEKRIDSLNRMLGPLPENNSGSSVNESNNKSENIVDSLLSANTMLNEATTGREQAGKCLDRAAELEKYLNPNFLEDNQQVRSKEVYLNAVAPDLNVQCEQLEKIKKLEPTLGAEYFRNMPSECLDKLKEISADNIDFAHETELIEESLILAMKRYGEIQQSILNSVNCLSDRLEIIEQKMEEKKREELERELPAKE